ncbi:MAG: hypothetical protein M3P42_04840 [Actinomycetota bacterium]|nr:hypothetical protein [Actinomycetota bacterium]
MRFLLVILIPVVAFSVWQHRKGAQNEERLGEVASAIAQRSVAVDCPGFWRKLVDVKGEDGQVDFDVAGRPTDSARLSARTCDRLEDFSRAGTKPAFDCLVPDDRACRREVVETARSLSTLAHEAYHLAGVRTEAAAECYAVQTVDFVTEQLGATPGQGRIVAVWAERTSARTHPAEYHSAECRRGGVLDLEPRTAAWP